MSAPGHGITAERAGRIGSFYKALTDRDFDAVCEGMSDDFEIDFVRTEAESLGLYRGREGAEEMYREWAEPYGAIAWQAIQHYHLGDLVASRIRQISRREGASVTVDLSYGQLSRWSGVRCTRIDMFRTFQDAVRSAHTIGEPG